MARRDTFDTTRKRFGLGKPLRVGKINRSTEEETPEGRARCSKERNIPPGKLGAFCKTSGDGMEDL